MHTVFCISKAITLDASKKFGTRPSSTLSLWPCFTHSFDSEYSISDYSILVTVTILYRVWLNIIECNDNLLSSIAFSIRSGCKTFTELRRRFFYISISCFVHHCAYELTYFEVCSVQSFIHSCTSNTYTSKNLKESLSNHEAIKRDPK